METSSSTNLKGLEASHHVGHAMGQEVIVTLQMGRHNGCKTLGNGVAMVGTCLTTIVTNTMNDTASFTCCSMMLRCHTVQVFHDSALARCTHDGNLMGVPPCATTSLNVAY